MGSTDFEGYSNTKLHENPSSGSRVVPSNGQTDGQTMTKLMVALWNFANAPKIPCSVPTEDQVSRLCMDLYSAA